MLLPLVVFLLIGLALGARALGGVRSPDAAERAYVFVAPLPAILSLLAPAIIGLTAGFGAASTLWIRRVSWVGVGLSLFMLLAGAALLVRAGQRGHAWGWPLGSAVVLAAGPALVIVISNVLLRVASLVL